MLVKEKLQEYYAFSPFGEDGDINKDIILLYAGPYLIPMPNSNVRREAIPYHDLHHMFTGYSNSRIGEGEVGAWELGSNCWQRPITVLLNLGGLSTGFLYSPRRMCKAFLRGCRSRNLYSLPLNKIYTSKVTEIASYMFVDGSNDNNRLINYFGLFGYFSLAVLAIPFLLVWGWLYAKINNKAM